jgi:hypothetical protein
VFLGREESWTCREGIVKGEVDLKLFKVEGTGGLIYGLDEVIPQKFFRFSIPQDRIFDIF